MNIVKNDKVILKNEIGNLKKIGSTYRVVDITNAHIVVENIDNNNETLVIEIDEFENYFDKKENIKEWTTWQKLISPDGDTIAFYRTNMKKVQVKIDGFKGETTCHKNDEFNLYFGITLAYKRCIEKYLKETIKECEYYIEEYTKHLEHCKSNLIDNKNKIKMIINSLNK